jgi:hypothetical protein
MSLQECQTADEVRALARRVAERRCRQYQVEKVLLAAPIEEPPEPPLVPAAVYFWPMNDSRLGGAIAFPQYSAEPMPAYSAIINKPTIEGIKGVVARTFGVSKVDMTSDRREAKPAMARQIAMYLCKTMTGVSLPKIGHAFGNRDHTTVLHAIRKIETARLNNLAIDRVLNDLKNTITSGAKRLDISPSRMAAVDFRAIRRAARQGGEP